MCKYAYLNWMASCVQMCVQFAVWCRSQFDAIVGFYWHTSAFKVLLVSVSRSYIFCDVLYMIASVFFSSFQEMQRIANTFISPTVRAENHLSKQINVYEQRKNDLVCLLTLTVCSSFIKAILIQLFSTTEQNGIFAESVNRWNWTMLSPAVKLVYMLFNCATSTLFSSLFHFIFIKFISRSAWIVTLQLVWT